jgi:hypothetical protein
MASTNSIYPVPPELLPATYRHYKGGLYDVLFIALLEATEEWVVVYANHTNPKQRFVRPYTEFIESIGAVPRFQALRSI